MSPDRNEGIKSRDRLADLAPNIPNGLENLTSYHAYSATTPKDGSYCEISKLEKVDESRGFVVVETNRFNPAQVLAFTQWINTVFEIVPRLSFSTQQNRKLNLVDEIVTLARSQIADANASLESSSKPLL